MSAEGARPETAESLRPKDRARSAACGVFFMPPSVILRSCLEKRGSFLYNLIRLIRGENKRKGQNQMDAFISKVEAVNGAVNSFAWGPLMLLLLVGTGVYLTVRVHWLQVTHFGRILKNTVGSLFQKKEPKDDGANISAFEAVTTALAGTVGTGNIAGVTGAIFTGGAGAVFWMWVAAFFGMMVKYCEDILGIYYRRRNSEGAWSGGPMYYLEDGVGSYKRCKGLGRFLGIVFCIFTVLASFGIGNMSQINKITINFEEAFLADIDAGMFLGAPNVDWAIGLFLLMAVAIILLGGFRRVAAVSEKLIPFMCIAYIVGCLVVILMHVSAIPDVFASIFKFALGSKAIAGGAAGSAVQIALNTIKNGCKRGIFSNEAGLGSSVMVHSNTCAREPVKAGLWGIAEVFLDTMVICTLTAIVVLSSGTIDLNTGLMMEGANDATLVAKSFGASLGKPGEWFVVLVITLFAFTTVMGWSYYGVKVVEYLFGVRCAKLYRLVFILLIVFGAVMESNLAWDISDTFNGLMMIPNLIGILAQIPLIIRLTRNYTDRRIKGKELSPMLSFDPDIQKEAERAVDKGAD